MVTTATVARNLLRNSKSLPQILRGQILRRSNTNVNINNRAKEHQTVQSLFVSNQKLHSQIPVFHFSEMGSYLGSSSGGQSLVQRRDERGMGGFVVETRGNRVVEEEEEEQDEVDEDADDSEFDDEYDDFEDVEDFDDDDDGDGGNESEYDDDNGEDKKKRRM